MTESFASKKKRGRLPYSEAMAYKIADALTLAIKSGRYKSGDQLPTTKELMKVYKVSSHTTIRAREILFNRRLIHQPIRGRVTTVI